MSRESLDVLENAPLVDGQAGDDAATRLVALEHAYRELLDRVARYEQERGEIRNRLERVLRQLAALKIT